METNAQLRAYLQELAPLLVDSFYFLAIGLVIVYGLNRLASSIIYPRLRNPRIMRVTFGTLYTAILAIAVLAVLQQAGYDITALARITFLAIVLLAVLAYFLLPFFPSLPFVLNDMVHDGQVQRT